MACFPRFYIARNTKITAFLLAASVSGCSPGEPLQPATPAPTSGPAEVHAGIWPQVTRPAIDDSALQPRLELLLSSLTVEEKVGQIIQADIGSVTPEDVRRYRLGSVLNGGNSAPGGDDLAPAAGLARSGRCVLRGFDGYTAAASMRFRSCGASMPYTATTTSSARRCFRTTLPSARHATPTLMRRIGEVTAQELRITGQEWTFAPTIAVSRDVRWGRAYESYSEHPEVVRDYAAAIVRGLQGEVWRCRLPARQSRDRDRQALHRRRRHVRRT